MARLDEAKVEEIKQFLQRLEKLVPSPNTADSTPASMPAQQSGTESAPDVKLPASAIERIVERALLFSRTSLGTTILVAAVSALFSTCITAIVIREMISPQVADTEHVSLSQFSHAQSEQVRSATSQAEIVASEPTPAPAEPAASDPATNADVVPNPSVATVESAPAESELPSELGPPSTQPPAPEIDATPPQPTTAENPEEGRADPGKAPEPAPAENAPSPAPLPTPEPQDERADLANAPEPTPAENAPSPATSPTPEKPEDVPTEPAKAPEPAPAENAQSPVPAAAIPDAAQDLQRAQLMLGSSLSSGDIGTVRLLLESAAESGNGEAALLLGSTYDALRSQEFSIGGVTHDSGLARRWYERAAELGVQEAKQRLIDLDGSPVPEWRRLWLTTAPAPQRACSSCGPAPTKCTPRAGARCSRTQ